MTKRIRKPSKRVLKDQIALTSAKVDVPVADLQKSNYTPHQFVRVTVSCYENATEISITKEAMRA